MSKLAKDRGISLRVTDEQIKTWIEAKLQDQAFSEDKKGLHDRLLDAFRSEGFACGRHRMHKMMKSVLADSQAKKIIRRKKTAKKRAAEGKAPTKTIDHREARVVLALDGAGQGEKWALTSTGPVMIPEDKAIKVMVSWSPKRDAAGRIDRKVGAWVSFWQMNFGSDQSVHPMPRTSTRGAAIAAIEELFEGRIIGKVVNFRELAVACGRAS